ncbi:superinfection immunity protein [Streptomyces sp. NPDC060054]|uniref:superinfection immunity protein n=1 Tax=unclassified Streptomyces TaxID=2593676 RepID=UPI0009A0A497
MSATEVFGLLAGAIHPLPSLIALGRQTDNRWLVLATNVLFGTTTVSWVPALVLGSRRPKMAAAARLWFSTTRR